jgi:Uma2 family endonuclease
MDKIAAQTGPVGGFLRSRSPEHDKFDHRPASFYTRTMAEPVRSLPADREPHDDPFFYGYRWRTVRRPSGEVVEEQVPLTPDDLLDPELGDEVTQSDRHYTMVHGLMDILRRHFAAEADVHVASDLKMLWGIPGLPGPAPDVAVIRGLRGPERGWESFDVQLEGTRPCLILEVVSSLDAETRRNDYEKKVPIYERAGISEYLILDPPTRATRNRLLLTGYRLGPDGRYRPIEPERDGALLSATTGLRFRAAEDGQTLEVIDAATGQRLRTAGEIEAENARLRAELERLRNNRGNDR